MDTSLREIGQVAVPVTDIERATGFYRDVLGMQLLFQAPPGLAFFDLSGVRLMLDGSAAERAGGGAIVYYRAADLNATYSAALERGAEGEASPHRVAQMPDHELWMAFLRDPDGNPVGLMSEVRG